MRVGLVELVLGVFEVVQVGGIILRAARRTGYQVGKLARKLYLRWLRQVQQGQFVEHVGEPLRLLFPVQAQSPERVAQRLLAHAHLRGEGLLVQVHHRAAKREVLVELIVPVHAEHRLALHGIVGIRLEGGLHISTRIDDALVQDSHLACRVVHGVVASLLQLHAARRHLDRPLRHVVGTEGDDVGRVALELSRQQELVLLGYLLGHGLGRVVQLVEAVLVGQRAKSFLLQVAAQVVAERLCRGQEDAAIVHGVALHEVELPVGVGLLVVVQAVQAHHLQQSGRLQRLLRQVVQVGARGVALVLDVHSELLLLHARCQVVHVLHHQRPVALRGVVRRVLQRLHEDGFVGLCLVGRELTHLIGLAAVGVLVGHGQHLVGLQARLQRHIAQGRVHGVFARRQQACARQAFVVHPARYLPGEVLEYRGHVVAAAVFDRDSAYQGGVEVVGQVRRHAHARRAPVAVADNRVLA